MSHQDAETSSENVSSSMEESDESRQERNHSESYFVEKFEEEPVADGQSPSADNASDDTVSTTMLIEPEALSSSREKSSSANEYSDEQEPDIEEAIKLLRREATSGNPRASYVGISSTYGFEPHEYKLPRKVSQTSISHASSPKVPHSPSLLSNILVPSPVENQAKTIPALRSVSGQHQVIWRPRRRSIRPMSGLEADSITPPERARIAKMTDSEMEMNLDTLREYQRDIEATAGRGTDTLNDSMHIQHVNSSSIQSFDSKKHGFHDIYSIRRILGVILVCIVVPPFFFMIASGEGVSSYRLMRLIMNSDHRIKLMKGFIWDVDVSWFRYTCLVLGIIEALGILACIGSGLGVGITRELRVSS